MQQIKLQRASRDLRALAGEMATLDDRETREQLGGAEGFRHVIIRTALKSLNFDAFLIAHTENEHRHVTPLAQAFQNIDAVHARKTKIQQDDIRSMKRSLLQTELAIRSFADLIAARFQHHAQQAAHLCFVVDDEGFAHGLGAACLDRKAEDELRAAFGMVPCFNVTFHRAHQAARDGETEPRAASG